MSARLSRRKLENIRRTGATMCITSNAGCAPANRPRGPRARPAAARRPSDGSARLELPGRIAGAVSGRGQMTTMADWRAHRCDEFGRRHNWDSEKRLHRQQIGVAANDVRGTAR